MRYIDAFNHFFPKRYYDALLETPAGAKDLGAAQANELRRLRRELFGHQAQFSRIDVA